MVGARLRILLLLQQQEQRRTEGQSLFARQSDGVTGKMTGQERKSMDSGKEVNGKEVNGDFTAERHAPQCERRGLSPTPAGPPVTSRVVQRTGTTLPLTPEEGERRVRGSRVHKVEILPTSAAAHTSPPWLPAGSCKGQRRRLPGPLTHQMRREREGIVADFAQKQSLSSAAAIATEHDFSPGSSDVVQAHKISA